MSLCEYLADLCSFFLFLARCERVVVQRHKLIFTCLQTSVPTTPKPPRDSASTSPRKTEQKNSPAGEEPDTVVVVKTADYDADEVKDIAASASELAERGHDDKMELDPDQGEE